MQEIGIVTCGLIIQFLRKTHHPKGYQLPTQAWNNGAPLQKYLAPEERLNCQKLEVLGGDWPRPTKWRQQRIIFVYPESGCGSSSVSFAYKHDTGEGRINGNIDIGGSHSWQEQPSCRRVVTIVRELGLRNKIRGFVV
ncbi:MAG: hypothetical protein EZS28_003123 [Streblomastix strix]|uniref:Uncharacterized protein n=1 Tax=Streblomastix strix TaxID=222440 RepID=A0A5J4X4B0_9EUKA|nr:MAG: hypothetical protein EZS28_003123 [Streblomastix strix]